MFSFTGAAATVTARRPFGGRARGVSVAVAVSVQAVSQPTRTGSPDPTTPVRRSGRTPSTGPTGSGSVGSFGAGGVGTGGRAPPGAAGGAGGWDRWARVLLGWGTGRGPGEA